MNAVTVSSIHDIPGWTYVDQLDQFKEIVNWLPESPRILEIGCGYGRSTWAWLDALPWNAEMYVLDDFGTPDESIYSNYDVFIKLMVNVDKVKEFQISGMNQEQIFFNNIPQHQKFSVIKNIWRMDSIEWTRNIDDKRWDLVYFDEEHSFERTKFWLEYFQNVKYVCGDDYCDGFPGLMSAVDRYTVQHNRRNIRNMFNSFFLIQNY